MDSLLKHPYVCMAPQDLVPQHLPVRFEIWSRRDGDTTSSPVLRISQFDSHLQGKINSWEIKVVLMDGLKD